jgi:PDZ domain
MMRFRAFSSPHSFRPVIFQEDYSGCWVTKVLPKGNADLKGIEAGDQLAAVNGRSSVGMKVDDICVAISGAASESKEIEFTFLRYIGPFRPLESDGASRADDSPSIGRYPLELTEDEKPRSTMSLSTMSESKASKASTAKSSKRGSLRKRFKWLSRGKKQKASKAE